MKLIDKYYLNERNFPYIFKDNFRKRLLVINLGSESYYLRCINDVIKNIKDYYYINANGLIWSEASGDFLSSYVHKTGYVVKTLSCYDSDNTKSFRLHRLVMLTFDYHNDHDQLDINHIDGDKENNHLYNLEWCTRRYNVRHAINNNLIDSDSNINNLSIVHTICENLQNGSRPKKLSEKLSVSYDSVKDIKAGKSYTDISSQYNLDVNMHPAQTLYLEEVEEIYQELKKKLNGDSNKYYREIGEPYNVGRGVVRRIRDWYKEKGDL